MPNLLHSVALADLDHRGHAKLSVVWPHNPEPKIKSHTDKEVAATMFPACTHSHDEDTIFLRFTGDDSLPLYGTAYYVHKRGRAFSVLCVSTEPHYRAFLGLIKAATNLIRTHFEEEEILAELYAAGLELGRRSRENGDAQNVLLSLRNRVFVMPPLPTTAPNEFGGASLSALVQRFSLKTMSVWYALISQQRVLVHAETAEKAGSIIIAMPLLVGSLGAIIKDACVPHVIIDDLSPLSRAGYVCGTSSSQIPGDLRLWDVCCDARVGTVRWAKGHQLQGGAEQIGIDLLSSPSGKDKQFIEYVCRGLERGCGGEAWVRKEFDAFTKAFFWMASVQSPSPRMLLDEASQARSPTLRRRRRKHLSMRNVSRLGVPLKALFGLQGRENKCRTASELLGAGLDSFTLCVSLYVSQQLPLRSQKRPHCTPLSLFLQDQFVVGEVWIKQYAMTKRICSLQTAAGGVEANSSTSITCTDKENAVQLL